MIISIPELPMTLNKMRNAHYFTINKEKQRWKEMIAWQVKGKRIGTPCRLEIEFHVNDNRRHDIDNLSAKFILDGLVEGGLIPDDDYKHINQITCRIIKSDKKETRIII